jgi:hypothetical protein
MNGFVRGQRQTSYARPQPPGEPRVADKEVQRGGFDGSGAAHPPSGVETPGVLNLAAEFALEKDGHETMV